MKLALTKAWFPLKRWNSSPCGDEISAPIFSTQSSSPDHSHWKFHRLEHEAKNMPKMEAKITWSILSCIIFSSFPKWKNLHEVGRWIWAMNIKTFWYSSLCSSPISDEILMVLTGLIAGDEQADELHHLTHRLSGNQA